MRHFLTASHGPLAGAILKSAAFIGGEDVIAGVGVIEVLMEDSGDTIRERVESVFSAYGEDIGADPSSFSFQPVHRQV